MFLKSGPSLLYVFKKWSEFTLKVVRVYLKSGPSLPGPSLLVYTFRVGQIEICKSVTNYGMYRYKANVL